MSPAGGRTPWPLSAQRRRQESLLAPRGTTPAQCRGGRATARSTSRAYPSAPASQRARPWRSRSGKRS
eukprot:6348227-Pyramimonas_sp.AAC.1